MPQGYSNPGVSVSEVQTPAGINTVGAPAFVCIVGAANGKQGITERLVIQDTVQTLARTGVDTSSIVVKLASDLTTINAGNYTVVQATDPDTSIVGDETYTIVRNAPPGTGTTVGATNAGNVDLGTYVYAVSFVRVGTTETGVSVDSGSVTITTSAKSVDLSAVPIGPAGTTARNIYRRRTSAGTDGKYHWVGQIANNSGQTFTDNTAVASVEVASTTPATFGFQPVTGLLVGDNILVSYNYTNALYYQPTLLDDFNDLQDKYGAPFDVNGGINSKLTYAARLAFANGANEVVALAVATDDVTGYTNALNQLKTESNVAFVVPASGDPSIHALVTGHLAYMASQGFYRMAVVGRDGSASAIPAATLRTAAAAFNNEAVIQISPATFKLVNPVTGVEQVVGAQWMAAAVAGMFAARDTHVPLTRKIVAGFSNENEKRQENEKRLDAQSGLMVVENKGGLLRVRHGVTTAIGAVNSRESSVVRTKYEMSRRLRESLDRLVGIVAPPSELPGIVSSTIVSVLDGLRLEQSISDFSGISARQLLNDPTTVEARFEYVPVYPLNNIAVLFRVNTESGEFALQPQQIVGG